MKKLKIMKHNFDRWVYNTNIFTFLIWTALITDALYIAMFMWVSQYILVIVSAAKIMYYLSIIKKKTVDGTNSLIQMLGMGLIVYISLILSTLFMGTECGFNTILLSLIPVFFFAEYLLRDSSVMSYGLSVIILITNFTLIFLNDRFVRVGALTIIEKNIFESFNWLVAICLTVFSATVFMAEVFNISNGLTNQNKKLNVLANYDPLTQLLLRRPMLECIDKCVEQKKLYSKDYAICIGDIDFFKKFNDQYGHDCGDVVLKTISRMIADGADSDNYVCRWGGEEIMILFPDTTVYQAQKIVERIRQNIENAVIHYKDAEVHVTMTFGISSSEKHIMSQEVIESADKALYAGKESGRNRVCCG